MTKSRNELRKPLGRDGYRKSSEVASCIEKGGYGKKHANLLAKILENWVSEKPLLPARFDTENLRVEEELDRLKLHAITAEGGVYRPTAYGLALMVALSAPGGLKLASACAKVYAKLRKAYFKNPEDPWVNFRDFQKELDISEAVLRNALLFLHDISVCSVYFADSIERISISPTIRDKEDIWGVFERMVKNYAAPISTVYGGNPLLLLDPTLSGSSPMPEVMAMCPAAFEEWKKTHERLMPDPSGAITSARSMVEAAIKWIHHERQVPPPTDGGTGKRLKDCLKLLGGADSDFEKPGVRQMVTGMESAINSLDTARNAMGDGHGKEPGAPEAGPRVARLIVGLATTITTFLLATYESRQRP